MNATLPATETVHRANLASRARLLSRPREPLFIADWMRVLMVHLEVDPHALQPVVPFALDLFHGRAFVTLVAFTMRGMRPRRGGKLGAMLFRPVATQRFLNVRTYVQHGREPGIHFLAEWLNSRLAVRLGPPVFALPYRHGRIEYDHPDQGGAFTGCVRDTSNGNQLTYRCETETAAEFTPCIDGSLDAWLMERYTAFNGRGRRRKFFRVWHEPWRQHPVECELIDRSLLAGSWPFLTAAPVVGANYSPGVRDVWMGWPHAV